MPGGGIAVFVCVLYGLLLMLVTVFKQPPVTESGPWMAHVKTAFWFRDLALPVFYWSGLLARLGFTSVVAAGRRFLLVGPLSAPGRRVAVSRCDYPAGAPI